VLEVVTFRLTRQNSTGLAVEMALFAHTVGIVAMEMFPPEGMYVTEWRVISFWKAFFFWPFIFEEKASHLA
jgi:hypothetical protein